MNMDKSIFNASCVLFTSALLTVGLRLYCRKLTKAGLGWDDGLILAATALLVALFGLSIHLSTVGDIGEALSELSTDRNTTLTLLLVFEALYLFAMYFTKLSAIFLYMRVFVQKRFQIICKIIASFIAMGYVSVLLQTFTVSQIAVELWNNALPTIADKRKVDIGIASFDIVSNVIVIILPIHSVWELQMRTSTKISLTVLFSLGLCVTVVSFYRLNNIIHSSYDTDSFIGTGLRDMYLHVLEPELAIFSLCLPVLRPLWRELREKYNGMAAKPSETRQSSVLVPGGRRKDDGEAVEWANFITDEARTQYEVSVQAGTPPASPEAKPDRPKRYGLRIPGLRKSPLKRATRSEPLTIKVERTWKVSYEAAATLH
ncbi:hypothetical protein GGR54DRAFT_649234 [Hypoxylon sp. NC1633]|nr:hypothetical protein GGR54DRAFT_649234 [Hypoxylon sp. NC1633]